MVIQYTIWTNSASVTAAEVESSESIEVPVHKTDMKVIRQQYILTFDDEGKVIVVKREIIIEV